MTVELDPRWSADETQRVEEAAKAFLAHRTACALLNAARPAVNATSAERYLYTEREVAKVITEKELHSAAVRLAQVAPALLIRYRALLATALSPSSPVEGEER